MEPDPSSPYHALERRLAELERRFDRHLHSQSIFEKAFRVIGLHTHFAEFGAFRGGTLTRAYRAAELLYRELAGDHWKHARSADSDFVQRVTAHWDGLRFFAFDSFQGLPAPEGPDRELPFFEQGTYACTEEQFRANLTEGGFPLEKLVTVPGFFEDTCTAETAARIGFERIGIVHIDSDLYRSAKTALDFIVPYLHNPCIVIFDEWYQYFGHPHYGEQRAFREWREAHPEWVATEFHKEAAMKNSFILSRV
jgi:O-methyltransferase